MKLKFEIKESTVAGVTSSILYIDLDDANNNTEVGKVTGVGIPSRCEVEVLVRAVKILSKLAKQNEEE